MVSHNHRSAQALLTVTPPSPGPLLRLLSRVSAFLLLTNYGLSRIRLYYIKVVNSIRLLNKVLVKKLLYKELDKEGGAVKRFKY